MSMLPVVAVTRFPVVMSGIVKVMNLAGRAGGMSGRGTIARLMQATGVAAAIDLIWPGGLPAFFGFGSSEADEIESTIFDAIESGAISDNRFAAPGGQKRPIAAVITLYDDNGDFTRGYAMDYRPFSKSTLKKIDNNQDTYRRPTRARRQVQGRRSRRS